MNKTYVKPSILLAAALFSLSVCYGQTSLTKGSKFVSVKYGSGAHSVFNYGQADVGWMYTDKLGLRVALSIEKAKLETTNLSVGRINCDNTFNLFNLQSKFYGNAVLGGFVGYEAISSTRDPLSDRTFVFGAAGGAELSYMVTGGLSVKLEFLQYYMQGSKVSPWFYTGTIGVSYMFN